MKKTYPLHVEGKHPDRVLDAIKHDLRKYVQRERRKPLPEGADFWDFDCRFGSTSADAQEAGLPTLNKLVDGVASAGGTQVYVEILAKPGQRTARPDLPETPPQVDAT